MKFVPGAAPSCMRTDIAQTEGILQPRGKSGAKTEHQKIKHCEEGDDRARPHIVSNGNLEHLITTHMVTYKSNFQKPIPC